VGVTYKILVILTFAWTYKENMDCIPGTLIFNLQGQLLYFNRQARIYLDRLNVRLENSNLPPQLPEEILFLFQKTKDNLNHERPEGIGEVEQSIMPNKSEPLLLRCFVIGGPNQVKSKKFILLLIEPASKESLMNISRAATIFHLTHREIEVTSLICKRMTKKEIGELLFISEQTVKWHVNNIMRKMKVHSRTQIKASLLNLPRQSSEE
jgi:DNA-binding CsgD family transcriptional regulator